MYISVSVIHLDIKETSVREKKSKEIYQSSVLSWLRGTFFWISSSEVYPASSVFRLLVSVSVSLDFFFFFFFTFFSFFCSSSLSLPFFFLPFFFFLSSAIAAVSPFFPVHFSLRQSAERIRGTCFAQSRSLYWLSSLLLATRDQIRAACLGSDVFFWQIYIGCYSNGIRASTMPN